MVSIKKAGEVAKGIIMQVEKKGATKVSVGLENAIDEVHFKVSCGGSDIGFKTVQISQLARPSLTVRFYQKKLIAVSFDYCTTDEEAEKLVADLEDRLIGLIENV